MDLHEVISSCCWPRTNALSNRYLPNGGIIRRTHFYLICYANKETGLFLRKNYVIRTTRSNALNRNEIHLLSMVIL